MSPPERLVSKSHGTVRANRLEAGMAAAYRCRMTKRSPFRYFKTSPEIIRLAVMVYVRFPLSLRNVEDLLHERSIEISHETVRFWWNRFGPMFAAEIRKKAYKPDARILQLAVAFGRGFCKDQRLDSLPVAGGGSRRRSPEKLCDEAPGSQSGIEIPREINETPWSSRSLGD
jgi:putative transposase